MKWFWGTLVLLVGLLGCRGIKMESSWRAQKIRVDGRDGEWVEKYVFDKEGAIIGLANDAKHLYVFLSTRNRNLQMKLLRQGFSVSFDPKGGKKSGFGVRYPLGLGQDDLWLLMESMRGGGAGWNGGPMQGLGGQINEQMLQSIYDTVIAEGQMEILGGGRVGQFFSIALVPEIEVALSFEDGRLVYELKVPLARVETKEYRIGIGVPESRVVGIGFQTPELDRRALRRQGDPRIGGSEMGGMGGMGRGDGYRRRRGVGIFREVMQPFQLWAKVDLAVR